MFVAQDAETKQNVEAANASKNISYVCRNCKDAVILAKGQKRRAHFRHGRDSSCAYGSGETWQHEEAKAVILDAARARGLTAFPEVEVISIEGDRRADVLIFAPQTDPPKPDDKRRLAIEVQYSAIESSRLTARTTAYMAALVPVIWIPVIDQKKFQNLYRVVGTNLFCASGYSTPVWVEEIESIHGHLWLYVPESKVFYRGHLLTDWRWKNHSEGYDSDGNFHSSGGYWFEAAKSRDLILQGPYQFNMLKLVRVNRDENKRIGPPNVRKFFVDLVSPDSGKLIAAPVQKRRQAHLVDGRDTGHYEYVNWVEINGEWKKAVLEPIQSLPSD